ncbi:Os04g0597833 [Oryza sativa Japonica Group]|uniref:Os04g0597833 protein n=1 Tax=Oryza sativa subsp. japonica TaxID=39947 RepID=A0A0P0WEA7_ORYSJ|nr:Os04g0597833 [Oryza sativa Japonica Group]
MGLSEGGDGEAKRQRGAERRTPFANSIVESIEEGIGLLRAWGYVVVVEGSKLWTWMRLVLPMPEKETVYRLVRGGQQ